MYPVEKIPSVHEIRVRRHHFNYGGICQGSFEGCPCLSGHGKIDGDCNKNGCQSFNDPNGGRGFCTGGNVNGCGCTSICGSNPGPVIRMVGRDEMILMEGCDFPREENLRAALARVFVGMMMGAARNLVAMVRGQIVVR